MFCEGRINCWYFTRCGRELGLSQQVKHKAVHISALLLTLSEVTSKACTSMACIWSRPTSAGKAMLATNLDFGEATDEGYVVPDGPCLDPSKLLEECRKEGIQTGVGLYFIQEAERHKVVSQTVAYEVDSAPLIDPMEKLSKIERPINRG